MSKAIQDKIEPLEGYLVSMTRNTKKGWYELEIGIPKAWVYKSNDIIKCEELNKSENGVLLKIVPKINDVVVDDLFDFVGLIVDVNAKIVEKEKEFNERMDSYKKELEEQAKKFYEELDSIKEISFTKFDKPTEEESKTTENNKTKTSIEEKSQEEKKEKSRVGRPKGSKNTKVKSNEEEEK